MANLSVDEVFGNDTFLSRLCAELDASYPPINPTPKDELSAIMYRAGQRSVVEYILDLKGE